MFTWDPSQWLGHAMGDGTDGIDFCAWARGACSDHLNEESQAKNYALPTFLYAMPFDETHIFLEETSLVARPEVRDERISNHELPRLAERQPHTTRPRSCALLSCPCEAATNGCVESCGRHALWQVTFDELKDRMAQRLHALGIRIKSIEEDEYCLIPMGGVLPTFPQRTLGIGGTAGMVHPSTGCVNFRTCAW